MYTNKGSFSDVWSNASSRRNSCDLMSTKLTEVRICDSIVDVVRKHRLARMRLWHGSTEEGCVPGWGLCNARQTSGCNTSERPLWLCTTAIKTRRLQNTPGRESSAAWHQKSHPFGDVQLWGRSAWRPLGLAASSQPRRWPQAASKVLLDRAGAGEAGTGKCSGLILCSWQCFLKWVSHWIFVGTTIF